MYTYERLVKLCSEESNDADIARYLLKHLHSLDNLSLKKTIEDIGISKASFHRFYSKAGYDSFKDLITLLSNEVREKEKFDVSYSQYKNNMISCIENIEFNNDELDMFIRNIKKTKKIAFYGNSWQISCFKRLFFYLCNHEIEVIFLDGWDIKNIYNRLENFSSEDMLVIVETGWRIQGYYEKSINLKHMLNLDIVNNYKCKKYFIGDAINKGYKSYMNIKIPHHKEYMPYISLNLLDEKILDKIGDL